MAGDFYDVVGGGMSLEASKEVCKCSCGGESVDAGIFFDIKIGVGIGSEENFLGTKFGGELLGPQLGEKLELHYVKECGEDKGAVHVDEQVYLSLSGEASLGAALGLGVKGGLTLAIEYGIEADATGADGYVTLKYEWTFEPSTHLAFQIWSTPFHGWGDQKTFKTPRIRW